MGGGWSSSDIPSVVGETILVTGANTGLGFSTAKELGRAGATVIIACRDERKGQAALKELREDVPNGAFELAVVDVSKLDSVRAFASGFLASGRQLDVLINNAGIMNLPTRQQSAEGIELQMATNHVGHFALTGLLLPALQRSPRPRVVNVSSMLGASGNALRCVTALTNPQDVSYRDEAAYSDSKLANLLFTVEMARRYPGILCTVAHPGVSTTNLFQHNCFYRCFIGCCCCCCFQSPDNGALPQIRAAVDPTASSGTYFGPKYDFRGAPILVPIPFAAKDDKCAADFWDASVRVTGVQW
jgi:NAD(P)-dependent dehydrogenase (short-subunit alcohol dehydrogenase family)